MKKENVTFVFDVLLVRKYKKQILLANLAGTVLMIAFIWVKYDLEERKERKLRSVEDLPTE